MRPPKCEWCRTPRGPRGSNSLACENGNPIDPPSNNRMWRSKRPSGSAAASLARRTIGASGIGVALRKVVSATAMWTAGGALGSKVAIAASSNVAVGTFLAEHGALSAVVVGLSGLYFSSIGSMRGTMNAVEYVLIDKRVLLAPMDAVLASLLPPTASTTIKPGGKLAQLVKDTYSQTVAHIKSRGVLSRLVVASTLPRLDAVMERWVGPAR